MPTMRLVPSMYSVSSSTYLSVSNAANMYHNTDNETYATVTNSQSGTTSYYIYIKGFNFSSLPSDATVTDWTVKLKARESGVSTSSSYAPKLCNNTSRITSTMSAISTTATTREFTGVSADWDDIVGYGANFGIRINCRRASRNTTGYVYIYGAEIEVTYTVPIYHAVTVQNSTSATVTASDTNPSEGENVIIFADTISGIAVKDNGADVTSQFVKAQDGGISQVSGNIIETVFSDSGGAFYISSSTTSTDYLEYACGNSAEIPGTATSTNTYVKGSASGNTTTGTAIYSFDFSDIPPDAAITSMSVKCYCAREDATIDSTHVCRMGVYSGSTLKGAEQNITSTSYSIVELSNPGTWTREELQHAKFHFTLGYYGGRIAGITWYVSYEANGYEYTISNIVVDHTIIVTAVVQNVMYLKVNGSWVAATTVYKKVNGSWVEQSDLTNVFDPQTNYVKA